MKLFTQPAPGYLKKRTRFNAAVMLFWAVTFFAVYVLYAKTAIFYAKNAATDGVTLDVAALTSEMGAVEVAKQEKAFDYDSVGQGIPESIMLEQVYRQGDYYRFLVPVDSFEMTDVGYYLSETGSNLRMFRGGDSDFQRQGEIKQRLGIVTVGGRQFAALIPYGSELRAGELIPCGVFSTLPAYVLWDLGAVGFDGEEISTYLLDFRDIPVESEGNEMIMLVIFSIIFPLFLLYAVACFIFPRLHMNYILLSREDDPDELSKVLEYEMAQEGVYKQSRQVYTEHYIIKETLHSTKVYKNHLNRH